MSEFKLAWWHFKRGFKELFHIGLKGHCSICGGAIFYSDSYAISGLHNLHCINH